MQLEHVRVTLIAGNSFAIVFLKGMDLGSLKHFDCAWDVGPAYMDVRFT